MTLQGKWNDGIGARNKRNPDKKMKSQLIEYEGLSAQTYEIIREYIFKQGDNIGYEELKGLKRTPEGLDLSLPIDWEHETVEGNRMFPIASFKYLVQTYEIFQYTGQENYGHVLIAHIYDFVAKNREDDGDRYCKWNDDAVANRTMTAAIIFVDCGYLADDTQRAAIADALHYNAALLAEDSFYKKKHNHGLHQDLALMVYGILNPTESDVKEYEKKAKKRALEYLDYVCTVDGIHKEHSPFYAFDTVEIIQLMLGLYEERDSVFSRQLHIYYDNLINSIVYFTKPNGMLPAIGDSKEIRIRDYLSKCIQTRGEAQWYLTGGQKGDKPQNEKIFSEGGYGIFRSNWEREDATWGMLVGATHSDAHKHSDDLEVLLYHKGDVFVEGGHCGYYNYKEEKCSWSYSGFAHNVLIVNDRSYPVNKTKSGIQRIPVEAFDTRIAKWDIGEKIFSVTGYEHRFADIEHWREVVFDRILLEVFIKDMMVAEKDYDGKLLWHIAADINVTQCGNSVLLRREDDDIAEISVESSVGCSVSCLQNSKENFPYVSWDVQSGNYEKRQLMIIHFDGQKGTTIVTMKVNLK